MATRVPRVEVLVLAVVVALLCCTQYGSAQEFVDTRHRRVAAAALEEAEWLMVACGDIPANETEQILECQTANRPPRRRQSTAGTYEEEYAESLSVPRPDLESGDAASVSAAGPNYLGGACTPQLDVQVPVFFRGGNGTMQYRIENQTVPELSRATVARVKRRAAVLAPRQQRRRYNAMIRSSDRGRSRAARAAGFLHPGGYAGAAELALMVSRLQEGVQPQVAANKTLITGRGVPPKVFPSGWYPPLGTPVEGYGGPWPMEIFEVDYGARNMDNATCNKNMPEGIPMHICGQVVLTEVDSRMAYRMAMAYVISGDERYAVQAMDICMAWAETNKVYGLKSKNGPLNAGWAVAPMARAMEILRATWPGFEARHLSTFVEWAEGVLMPQMDFFVDAVTPCAIERGRKNEYGNWHATIADAMMAVGILGDDRVRYEKGLKVYRETVREYFKWGRDGYAPGRILGEATETLRDIYHTLFGLGSLIQAAETAWSQNDDVYGEAGHVMAAAMELHARMIIAKHQEDESALPPGFKFFSSMPAAPENCTWRWDIETQLWSSYDANGTMCSELRDGVKYLVGIKYLPNGFEVGYNHYVGRLGMKLPETQALLKLNRVDWQEWCWGSGTLTHADTAKDLWRAGLSRGALCAKGAGPDAGAPAAPRPRKPVVEVTPPSISMYPGGGIGFKPPTVSVTDGSDASLEEVVVLEGEEGYVPAPQEDGFVVSTPLLDIALLGAGSRRPSAGAAAATATGAAAGTGTGDAAADVIGGGGGLGGVASAVLGAIKSKQQGFGKGALPFPLHT